MDWPVIWKTKTTIHVDTGTGEIITTYIAKQQYILIKTEKNVTFNNNKTYGYITYTKKWRRKPQTRIDFPDSEGENRK